MKAHIFFLAVLGCIVVAPYSVSSTNIWTDILSCVHSLANGTEADIGKHNLTDTNPSSNKTEDFSMLKLLSIICGDKDGFVQCLDNSLKQSSDSVAQIIGSLFDPQLVTQAYEGLCANITEIEKTESDVLSCLSKVKMTDCQNEMADYFFYMGVVKKFAPPSEQLSRGTMETLLCSVTFQRRQCEVRALRGCSGSLADVMEQFYTQTQPGACAEMEKKASLSLEKKADNKGDNKA